MTEKINLEELGNITGGANATTGAEDMLHNLSYFVTKTVCNVPNYDDSACLTLSVSPNGAIIPGVGWQNGDHILVHASIRENGWYFAYDRATGKYGYVNPNNIR